MSYRGVSAFGLAKEGFHEFGQFLDPAQRAERQPLHFLLGLDELPRDLAFNVCPNLLVGVQLRRIGRQGEEFELAVLSLDKVLDQLGLVNRVTIDDQKYGLLGAHHQAFEKFPKHFGADRAVLQHEAELTAEIMFSEKRRPVTSTTALSITRTTL